jgi:hypothetical protein
MKLLPLDQLQPAAYNPRAVDPERLDVVRLSLQKLGWLSPVYATSSGEILSGHQRTHVARSLGYSQVPAVEVPNLDANTRKAVNILFNRATNDMEMAFDPDVNKARIMSAEIQALGAALPDVPTDRFPVLKGQWLDPAPFVRANTGRWIPYARNVSTSLAHYGIVQPIIVAKSGRIVNGIGRLQMLAEKKAAKGYFVTIPDAQAEFATAMMNLLSMTFDIRGHYADLLRFNSFRRLRRSRSGLGRGFVFALVGDKPAYTFDINKVADRARWKRKYGTRIVDFGAGHLQETEMLRANGVEVTPFEPYHVDDKEQIDKAKSMDLARQFLRDVAEGKTWDSVFISSVLNSVPFVEDRIHIVRICAALCGPGTTLYAVATGDKQTEWLHATRKFLDATRVKLGKMVADYEPNVMLGELKDKPKAQKYHTPEMFYRLFKSAFETVKCGYDGHSNVYAIARKPLPPEGLREAIEFEFNLPYPDGSRMGLVEEALAAFSRRLGTVL